MWNYTQVRVKIILPAIVGMTLALPVRFFATAAADEGMTGAPATAPASAADSYLPLTKGTTWKYMMTVKDNGAADKPYVQTVVVGGPVQVDKLTLIPIDNDLYQIRDGGIELYGRRDPANAAKIVAFDEPRKLIPVKLRAGDKWNWTAGPEGKRSTTYCTCFGDDTVKTEAGTFNTLCVFSSTSNADETEQRQVYRYYARGVGIVRETIHEMTLTPDGKADMRDITRELMTYSIGKPETAASGSAGRQGDAHTAPTANASTSAGSASPAAAQALFEEGLKLAADHQHAAALAKYSEALKLDDRRAEVHAHKAVSHLALGQTAEAWAEVQQALRVDDKDSTYWEIAGQVKATERKADEARGLYDKAAALSPARAGVIYTDLAAALAASNDDRLSGAIESALKSAAVADPPSAEAIFQLGQSYASAGRPQAKAYLQRYVDLVSQLPQDQRDASKLRVARQLIRAVEAMQP